MGSVRIIKNPFDKKCEILAAIDFGTNLQTIVDNIDVPDTIKKSLKIYKLDENLDNPIDIPESEWINTYPKDNEHYQIFTIISGRGSGKQVTRMVAMMAVMIAAAWAGPALVAAYGGAGLVTTAGLTAAGSAVAGAVTVGLGVAGSLAINALIPLPENQKDIATDSERSLSGSSNQMSPYSPIPRIYGKTRFSPYKVAPDYTEVVGTTTYLRSLFCFGYGPLKISDIKIGTNSLDVYNEVDYEIREGWDDDKPITLYTNTVQTQNYSIKLWNQPNPTVFTSLSDNDELSFDIYFPGGIWATRPNSGSVRWNAARFFIQYRIKGDDTWTILQNGGSKYWDFVYITKTPFSKTIRVPSITKGTYEVSIQQLIYPDQYGDNGSSNFCAGYLTTVRNIKYENPVRAKGLCLMALRIKATDQLNGTIDNVSALCESIERCVDLTANPNDDESTEVYVNYEFRVEELNNVGDTYTYNIQSGKNIVVNLDFPDGLYNTKNGGEASVTYEIKWKNGDNDFVSQTVDFPIQRTTKAFKKEIVLYSGEEELQDIVIEITKISLWSRYWRDPELGNPHWAMSDNNRNVCTCKPKITWQSLIEKSEDLDDNMVLKLNRHPAWHVYDILTGTACATPVDKSMIDIESFINWEKTYPEWYVDVAIDGDYTRLECIKNMCSAAKAYFTIVNGKYTIVCDKPNKIPVAAISPRNSYNFSFTKSFEKDFHGFKVKYIEPERDWSEQEVIVYNSGYDSSNATSFETIETYGCTDRERAWKFGKYMLGQYVLRPETYTVSQDIENLAVNIGDLVLLSHDVLKVGVGSARIKEVYLDEDGRANAIWIDDKFYLPNENGYSIVIRNTFGKLKTFMITGNTEPSDMITFPTPIPASELPDNGEQVFIGITDRIALRTLVTKIEPSDDLSATLTLVPEAPEIHDESDEEIPPFDANMTIIPEWVAKAPLSPLVENIVADERSLIKDATGGYRAAISFDVKTKPEETEKITSIQVYSTMELDAITYKESYPYTGNDTISCTHVEDGRNCTVSVRYVSDKNIASDWTSFDVYVEGRTNRPPDVLNLDRQGYNITWNYDNKPLDFAGFRVYYNYGNDTWKDYAVKAHTQSLWDSPPFTTATLPKEQLTLFVVAVDTAGNESANPAIISFYNGDVEYDNIIKDYDYQANNFPGKIENGFIFDNVLYANEDSKFYNNDNTKFYKSDEENFYRDISYSPLEYEFVVGFDGSIENAYVKLDWEMEGIYKIYYKRENRERFYGEDSSVFYKEDSELFYPQDEHWYLMPDKLLIGAERVTIKIIFEEGDTQGIIRKLKATIDAPDVTEYLAEVDIDADGTRLPVTKNFKVINKVFLTLLGMTEAISARVIDKNVNGPMIQAYDASGNPVNAKVNADIRGYK